MVGKDLGFFRFVTDDKAAEKTFLAAYGPEPAQINVYLPHRTVDENFPAWKEAYAGGVLLHRCDGETCTLWLRDDGSYSQDPKPCPGGCKEVGRLNVIIIELGRFAYVTVETHSKHDIMTLTGNLQAALALRGSLAGIPFILSRKPREITWVNDEGKRQRVTKSLLSIEPHPDWVRVRMLEMRNDAALPAGILPERQRLTTAPDPLTGEIVDDDEDDEDDYDGDNAGVADAPDRVTTAQLEKLMAVGASIHGAVWGTALANLIGEITGRPTDAPRTLTKGEYNEALLTVLGKAAFGDEWKAHALAICANVGKDRLAQLDQASIDALVARLESRLAERKTE